MTLNKLLLSGSVLVLALGAAACGDDNDVIAPPQVRTDTVRITTTVRDTIRIGNTTTVFDQMERLGNPLVSEVFVEKREHDHFNTSTPSEDVEQFRDDIVTFIRTVAGRDAAYAAAVAAALTPDMLGAKLDRARGANDANVGWLTLVLAPTTGFGGRKLTGDDAVDKGLSVTFGAALGNTNNVSPGLVTDNVPANDRTHLTTFPYLAPAN